MLTELNKFKAAGDSTSRAENITADLKFKAVQQLQGLAEAWLNCRQAVSSSVKEEAQVKEEVGPEGGTEVAAVQPAAVQPAAPTEKKKPEILSLLMRKEVDGCKKEIPEEDKKPEDGSGNGLGFGLLRLRS